MIPDTDPPPVAPTVSASTDSALPPSSSNATNSSSHYASAPPLAYSDQAAQPPAAKPMISSKDSTSLFSGGSLRPNCLSRGLTFRNTFLCQVSVKCGSSMSDVALIEQHLGEEEIGGVDFIIIASDGLWNVISNKEAVSLVQNITDAEAASRELIKEAYTRGSSDNITCVVVRFDIS